NTAINDSFSDFVCRMLNDLTTSCSTIMGSSASDRATDCDSEVLGKRPLQTPEDELPRHEGGECDGEPDHGVLREHLGAGGVLDGARPEGGVTEFDRDGD